MRSELKNPEAARAFSRARLHEAEDEVGRAIEAYTEAIAGGHKLLECHRDRAECLRNVGRLREAEHDLERVLELAKQGADGSCADVHAWQVEEVTKDLRVIRCELAVPDASAAFYRASASQDSEEYGEAVAACVLVLVYMSCVTV